MDALSRFYERFLPLLTAAYEQMEKVKPTEVGRECPDCGSPLVERNGRFGKFVACSNYPSCKHVEREVVEPVLTGAMCPNCSKPLVEKIGRFGKFVACSDYPTCKTIIKTARAKAELKPIGEMCPDCGSPLVERFNRFGKTFVGC